MCGLVMGHTGHRSGTQMSHRKSPENKDLLMLGTTRDILKAYNVGRDGTGHPTRVSVPCPIREVL